LIDYGILFGGSLKEFALHDLSMALDVDFPLTKPILFCRTDPITPVGRCLHR
jgi:hypothetical protein